MIKREVLDNFYIIGGAAVGIAFIEVGTRLFMLYHTIYSGYLTREVAEVALNANTSSL